VAQPILPFALELVVCEDYAADELGRVDLLETFHSIRPESYPHVHSPFYVEVALTGGLGELSTFIDIRHAETGELIYWTTPQSIRLESRHSVAYLLILLEDVPFPKPGIYFVELYCENTAIADCRIRLLESSNEPEGQDT
jgi:hypothetical protein